jgi:hypothetical protein
MSKELEDKLKQASKEAQVLLDKLLEDIEEDN